MVEGILNLIEMKKSIELITKEVNNTSLIAQSEAAATEEITATLEKITVDSQILADLAKIV